MRPRPNHLAIWSVALGFAAITVWLASRSLDRLDAMLPAESSALLHRHPFSILAVDGLLLAAMIAFVLYRRRAFSRVIVTSSDHRDLDGHAYVPLAWITRGRIAFGDAFFDREALYLVAYGDESAAEAAASKMGASGGALIGGAVLRERHQARMRVVEAGRKALLGQALSERVLSSVGSARFPREEIVSFDYGKWLGSKLVTMRGMIIVQDITPSDAAALEGWLVRSRDQAALGDHHQMS